MKPCTVSVINDLVTDQRVRKVCYYLHAQGFDVQLIGRRLPQSPPLENHPYRQIRMKLHFTQGPLFYAFFNIRLFFYLLFAKTELLVANDLDTLLPNFIISKMKGIPLVYDSHEYFTEVPELEGRWAKKIWLRIERGVFPYLQDVFTVNDSIAEEYYKRYGKRPLVLRNLPEKTEAIKPLTREELNLPKDKAIVLLQGSGINVDRGAEEAVLAMKKVESALLLIVGSGDVLSQLKALVEQEQLSHKVYFIPRQSPQRLRQITALADVGLSIDKDTNLNYRYSLPNKLFDYIQAGVPVLASNLPEIRKIVEGYQVGRIMENYSVESLAQLMDTMIREKDKTRLESQLRKAAQALSWDLNLPVLDLVYKKFITHA